MAEDSRMTRMKELVRILDEASRAYYVENREIMSNRRFDELYDELADLEEQTGTVLAGSPTRKVGYEAVDELPKETHESPMLSLAKTKDREEMRAFVGTHRVLMSWKLDGLTVVLTYRDGELQKAVTRGNGLVGDVITPNARVFRNIPLRIAWKGELVLRGEAVISYPDFEKLNESLGEEDAKYKNPRNLCSGSVRQLNSEVTAKRNVRFYAFALVSAEGVDFRNSRANSKILSVVTPPLSARSLAAWITGPSAVGSEKGMPSSIRSAPPFTAARTQAAVVARSGSPQVMKATNALPWSKALLILLTDALPPVAGNGGAVLVAPARYVDDHDLILPHGRGQLHGVGHGVGRLDGGDDALHAGQVLEGVHGLVVGDGHVFRPPGVVQPGVLRADAGVVQPRRDGIHWRDLAVFVLAEVALHAVEDEEWFRTSLLLLSSTFFLTKLLEHNIILSIQ